jgi:hypothetical protein
LFWDFLETFPEKKESGVSGKKEKRVSNPFT